MKKQLFRIISVFILSFAITSCESPLDEIVDSGDKPVVDIPLLNIDVNFVGDTIQVYRFMKTHLNFEVDTVGTLGYNIILDADTVRKHNRRFYSINYPIVYEDGSSSSTLEAGIHKLQLEIFTHSGSGSIADEMGLEVFVYKYFWYVNVIEGDVINLRADTNSNVLKLRWDRYGSTEFDYYQFLNNWTPIGTNPTIYKISDINTTFFRDSMYVGVSHNYRLVLYTKLSKYYSSQLYVGWDLPDFNGISIENGNYYLNWKDSKYQHLISDYYIVQGDGTEELISDPDLRRIQVYELGFRTGKRYWILPVSKYDKEKIKYTELSKYTGGLKDELAYTTNIGEQSGIEFRDFEKMSDGNILFEIDDTYKWCKYDPIERKTIKTYDQNFTDFSPDGNHSIYFLTENEVRYIYVYDMLQNKVLYRREMEDILGSITKFQCKISNNLIAFFVQKDGSITAYNIETEELLAVKKYSGSFQDFEISPSGKYFCVDNSDGCHILYIRDSQFVTRKSIMCVSLRFCTDSDEEVVYWLRGNHSNDPDTYIKMNITSLSKKTIFSGSGSFYDIDYHNKEFLAYNSKSKYIEIMDFDGNVILAIRGHLGAEYGLKNENALLINKQIFYEYGDMLDMRGLY